MTLTHTGWCARTCSRALTPFLALIMLAVHSPRAFPELRELHERAEVHHVAHAAAVDLPNLGLARAKHCRRGGRAAAPVVGSGGGSGRGSVAAAAAVAVLRRVPARAPSPSCRRRGARLRNRAFADVRHVRGDRVVAVDLARQRLGPAPRRRARRGRGGVVGGGAARAIRSRRPAVRSPSDFEPALGRMRWIISSKLRTRSNEIARRPPRPAPSGTSAARSACPPSR